MKEQTYVVAKRRCLRPACSNWAHPNKRGLCGTCYNAALKSGRSWEELIAEGKALATREPAKDWFKATNKGA